MYPWINWQDEVDQYEDRFNEVVNEDGSVSHTRVRGTVQQVGTNQNALNFNLMEGGIIDATTAALLLLNALRQLGWSNDAAHAVLTSNVAANTAHRKVEIGTKTLTNSLKFPFNNSQTSVALTTAQANVNYTVIAEVQSATGNVGEIVVSDKLTNGFKLSYTGSASSVTIKYIVIGGFTV